MPDHRCKRLQERYGLDLSQAEVEALVPLCTPKNRLQRLVMGDIHLIAYNGFDLIPVVRVFEGGRRGIATFMAPDYFMAGRRTAAREAVTGKAGKQTGWLRQRTLRDRRRRRGDG